MKQIRSLILLMTCLIMCTSAFCQDVTYKGVVVDEQSEPIIGASVVLKGTAQGSVTDLNGNYTVSVPQGSTLTISYVGYETREVKAGTASRVVLRETNSTLNEVVVVGYGTQRKVNLTGAVSAISGDDLTDRPVSDVTAALQGEMPGVQILRSSGEPGSETSGIRIRGFSSVQEAPALVLIDGMEGDMNLLDPNDIDNISVLKDAAAAAIYGSRAAAGVVLITTKKGIVGKPRVTYNGYFGINTPGNMPERVPAWKEQEMINESRFNESGSPEWNPEMTSWVGNPNYNYRPNNSNGRWDLFQSTNWVNAGVRDFTTQQNHSVSIRGGAKSIQYMINANYFTKNGLLKYGPNTNDRYNFGLKLNTQLNKYVDLNLNLSYRSRYYEQNSYGAGSILSLLYRSRGRQPIFNPPSDPRYTIDPYNGDLQVNAIDIMRNAGTNKGNYQAYIGRGELVLHDIVKGLRLRLTASRQAGYFSSQVNRRNLVWYDRLGKGIRFQANNPNSLEKQKNGDYHDMLEALLNYDFKSGKHSVSALGGVTYERYNFDQIDGQARNMNSNDYFAFGYYDSSLAANTTIKDDIHAWAMMSYIGRVNYNYDERYLAEANIRVDGSSRVAPENRYAAFPSFSAGWRVSEEKWFKVPVISNLKLRASWGQLGNAATFGYYDAIAQMTPGVQIDQNYYYMSKLPATDKRWETISTTNVGFDLGMLNNKLNLTADYYWKYNNKMLANVTVADIVGIDFPTLNMGKLKTWGWEIGVSWKDKIGQVTYQVGLNLSDAQNRLLEYEGSDIIKEGTVATLEGYPLNTIWGYKTDGYWSSRDEYLQYKTDHPGYQSFNDTKISGGDVRYVAQGNPDHTIGIGKGTPQDHGDLVNLGDANGRYFYGVSLSAQWKGFDASMMFQGVGKRAVMVNTNTMAPFAQTQLMPWTIQEDYWTPENTDAFWPRLYNYANNSGNDVFNFHPSDKWVQNGAYIRLKNVQVGYTVPINKRIIQRLRVYISGEDVWEHSNMLKVFDPETGNAVSDSYYPFFRTWSMGVTLTF